MAAAVVRRIVGTAASAAVVAMLSAAGAAGAETTVAGTGPTWSPDGMRVAFSLTVGSGSSAAFRIVTAPADGAGPVETVYAGKAVDGCCDPMIWSPAHRILFDSNFTLSSVSPRGGKPVTLATNVSWFTVSAGGATAAFDGPQGHSPSSVGVVGLGGGRPLVVPRPSQASDAVVGFSPDGTQLVLSRVPVVGAGPAMYMVERVKGGAPVALERSGLIGASRLPTGAVLPAWSPDGRWLAYLDQGKLEVVGTTGPSTPRTVAGWVRGAFSWSPDSKLLACFCGPDREHVHLTTVDPRGTRRTVLWPSRSLHYVMESSADLPQWSPDGSKLAFLARVGPGYPPLQIWVVGANGAGLRRIA